MSIAQRKDGRYIVKYKTQQGRWSQRSFTSEAEARQFEAENQYDKTENFRLTVAEAVLVFLKNTQKTSGTLKEYEFTLIGHDRQDGTHREGPAEFLTNKYVDLLDRRDLENMRENCRASGMCAASVNKCTGHLNAAFNWCVDQDLLHENPWAKYRRLPHADTKHREGTLEDFQKLYPYLPPWMQWAAKTALALCLRPGLSELFRLEWSAFDWRARAVDVYMPKVRRHKFVYPPEAYLAEAWPRFQSDGQRGFNLVCRGEKEQAIIKMSYTYFWDKACKKAGVRMPMYALRHIAASEMLAAGADLAAVAAQLGHKNITTTAAFYTHAVASAQRRAAAVLPSLPALDPLHQPPANLVRNGAGKRKLNQ